MAQIKTVYGVIDSNLEPGDPVSVEYFKWGPIKPGMMYFVGWTDAVYPLAQFAALHVNGALDFSTAEPGLVHRNMAAIPVDPDCLRSDLRQGDKVRVRIDARDDRVPYALRRDIHTARSNASATVLSAFNDVRLAVDEQQDLPAGEISVPSDCLQRVVSDLRPRGYGLGGSQS